MKPGLVVVFYANPAMYPPTCNAIRLLAEDFQIHVVCRDVDGATVRWPAGVVVQKVGQPGTTRERFVTGLGTKLAEYGSFIRAVRGALTRMKPRLVLAYEPHALVAAKLAACRVPIVYQKHEVEELEDPKLRTFGDLIARASRSLSPSAALMIFPEKQRAEYYRKFVPGGRPALIVPNFPLRTTFVRPLLDESALARRFARREVFYRGSIGPGTGVREAVQALAHLDPGFRLTLCGFGPEQFAAELGTLAQELGCSDRFENEGFVAAYEDLNERTCQASVGVMLYQPVTTNTRFSGAATNKIYEYAACGVPVVAPNRESFREVLGGERWVELVDASDPASIAAAVGRLLSNRSEYDAKCHAARAAFESRLNYESVFEPARARILELADVVDRRAPAPIGEGGTSTASSVDLSR